MTRKKLREYLNNFITSLNEHNRYLLNARLNGLSSVFPFNEYEYILMFLLDRKVIEFEEYERLRKNYVSSNKYLGLFSLAPRIFGQVWGEQHIKDLDSRFQKPNTTIDPNYDGEYDLILEGIKIEVKASRAINKDIRGSLVSKALSKNSDEPFWMNFQQLKLDICDVFIFIGVWVDQINYWVLTSSEVKNNKYISHQHRGGLEYQIGITNKNITEFDCYEQNSSTLCDYILKIISKRK